MTVPETVVLPITPYPNTLQVSYFQVSLAAQPLSTRYNYTRVPQHVQNGPATDTAA